MVKFPLSFILFPKCLFISYSLSKEIVSLISLSVGAEIFPFMLLNSISLMDLLFIKYPQVNLFPSNKFRGVEKTILVMICSSNKNKYSYIYLSFSSKIL